MGEAILLGSHVNVRSGASKRPRTSTMNAVAVYVDMTNKAPTPTPPILLRGVPAAQHVYRNVHLLWRRASGGPWENDRPRGGGTIIVATQKSAIIIINDDETL
jgi:hypothetical protein